MQSLVVEDRYKNSQILNIHKKISKTGATDANGVVDNLIGNTEVELINYTHNSISDNVKQININYKFFISFEQSSSSIKYGVDRIIQVFLIIKKTDAPNEQPLINHTMNYIHLDKIEKYVSVNSIIDLVDSGIVIGEDYTISITAKSLLIVVV